ncbi:hypothetical protein [Kutzneria sp. NPDC051319]|uniref:hypothetical protein n=1 Tax=Kutzneria sp. NPDC051319 TaxID=3155047 RepID=UPI003421CA51
MSAAQHDNTLYDHALRLHELTPDEPLPRDGQPFPDEQRHGGRRWRGEDPRFIGADVAVLLDRHFADAAAPPSALAEAFHDVHVPIHPNEHIEAAALRADRQRVWETGRWLVRHAADRCAVTVGLALLAADWHEEDIPLIRTIGLLSNHFGPLAARALDRREGAAETLLWLAQRVAGWGRVYVVRSLARHWTAPQARRWLLRHSCDGDYLNGYFAGQVATVAQLHHAITTGETDDELIEHTGRLLVIMADCEGMGTTLQHYPPAFAVLTAHATHFARLEPSTRRYIDAAVIADRLAADPEKRGCTAAQADDLVRRYLDVLNRPEWCAAGAAMDGEYATWFADHEAVRLRLRAFGDY